MEGIGQPEPPGEMNRSQSFLSGIRIWKVSWLTGLVIIAISIGLSYFFSLGRYSDAPSHDLLFSLPLVAGLLLMIVGATFFVLWAYLKPKESRVRTNPFTFVNALALATVIVGVYLVNPLVSPVAFLRDSDLDGVQDYSDEYPSNHSRIDHPWVSFGMQVGLSSTHDSWKVGIGYGGQSCWLDAMAVEVLNEDNSTSFERTLLADLGEEAAAKDILYFNMPKIDRLDVGDYFLIDRHFLGDGSKLLIWGYSHGWVCFERVWLRIP